MLMAAELERQGQQVAFLGLLDSYVPGTEAPAADDWREDLLDFLSVSAGLEARPPLAAGVEQRDNVSAAIAECLGVGQTGKEGWAATNWPRYSWSPGSSSNSPGNWIVARRSRSGRCAGGRAGVVKRCGRCRGNWVVSLWPVGSPRAGISRYPMRRRCSTPWWRRLKKSTAASSIHDEAMAGPHRGRPVEDYEMALNPDIAAYLELVGNGRSSGKSLPMHQLTVQQAREQFDQSSALMDPGLDEPLPRVETLFVPARDGTSLPARLYSPQGLSASPPLPGVLYLHGGGYVVGSLDSHDALCASLAERAGCVVLSLAYRLAPEWRFPTAAEDAEDAWCWLAAEAARLGIDPQRLAVAGDSVGGSLCAVLSHRLALRGDASQPRLQVLIYPVTDASRTRQSIERYAVGHLLEKDSLEWFYQHYQRSPEDRQDPRFSPLLGAVPADLAPTLLLVAECDPLHDEGIAYAEHLRQGGAQVELCVYPGMTHDFLRMGAIVDEADDAKDMIADALVAALAP